MKIKYDSYQYTTIRWWTREAIEQKQPEYAKELGLSLQKMEELRERGLLLDHFQAAVAVANLKENGNDN